MKLKNFSSQFIRDRIDHNLDIIKYNYINDVEDNESINVIELTQSNREPLNFGRTK